MNVQVAWLTESRAVCLLYSLWPLRPILGRGDRIAGTAVLVILTVAHILFFLCRI